MYTIQCHTKIPLTTISDWIFFFLSLSTEGLPDGSAIKTLPANAGETWVGSLGQADPLEKEIATYSSIRAWEVHGQRSLVAIVHGAAKDYAKDYTEQL